MSSVWEVAEREHPTPPTTHVPVDVPRRVVVVDVEMRFASMVIFMVKWVLASIPAIIVLALLAAVFSTFFGAIFQLI